MQHFQGQFPIRARVRKQANKQSWVRPAVRVHTLLRSLHLPSRQLP